MNAPQTVTTNQPCYLLNANRIAEKAAQRKANLVADFKTAVSDFYSEARWEGNCWEEMGGVIEYRKYVAELNDDEINFAGMYM